MKERFEVSVSEYVKSMDDGDWGGHCVLDEAWVRKVAQRLCILNIWVCNAISSRREVKRSV